MQKNQLRVLLALLGLGLLAALLWFALREAAPPLPKPCQDNAACPTGEVCCEGACLAASACTTSPSSAPPTSSAPVAAATAPPRRWAVPPPRFKKDVEETGECEKVEDCRSGLMACESGRCVEPPICLGDGDCGSGRLCYRGACEDKAPGCRPQDCPEGSYCNSIFGQCEFRTCKTDEQCAGERHCDSRGFCVECLSDDDCEGNQRCHIDSHCLEPERCEGNIDCRGLRVCDKDTSTCSDLPCLSDRLEPNDTPQDATVLASGDDYTDLVVCHENRDLFRLDLEAGQGALLRVLFDTSFGTIEVRVRDMQRKELYRYNDSEFMGTLLVPFEREPEAVSYLIDIQGYGKVHSTNAPLQYSIRRYDVPGGFCKNDGFEPSDTLPEAHRITPNHVFPAKLCKGDEDWYVMDVEKDQVLNVYVESIFDPVHPAQVQLLPDVEIYEEGKSEPVLINTEDDGPSHAKVVSYKSARSGPHYVRLVPALIDADTHYAIRLYTDPLAP
jgi:hypothetical protein